MDFEGRTIVVTGAASGIGNATAQLLADKGAYVIAVDRNRPGQDFAEYYQVDLSSPDSIERLLTQLPKKIDGLANIAGLPPTRPPADVLRVNWFAVRQLTLELAERMTHGASIVNLASLAGFRWSQNIVTVKELIGLSLSECEAFCKSRGLDGTLSYYLSKETLIAWTLQHRWTWLSRGVRMNAVSPGPVDTPILSDFVQSFGSKVSESIQQSNRAGTPADIAPVVAFLLSPESEWIRGANIPVDGGAFANILCTAHGV